jgi:hypothetical protein
MSIDVHTSAITDEQTGGNIKGNTGNSTGLGMSIDKTVGIANTSVIALIFGQIRQCRERILPVPGCHLRAP